MLRATGSVILGYLVMFGVVFATFSLAYLLLGPEGSFKPGTYEVSSVWMVISIVFGFAAAVFGGLVCAAVARSATPPKVLAAIVLVLGLASAIPIMTNPREVVPGERTGEVGNVQAMQNAQQPLWIALLNPLIGAVGVLVGAGLKGRDGEVA